MVLPRSSQGIASEVAALWRANALTLAHQLAIDQRCIVTSERRVNWLQGVEEVPEETRASAKQYETQAEHSEDASWLSKKHLVGVLAANAKLAEFENESASTTPEPDCPPVSSSPVFPSSQPNAPDMQASGMPDALEIALQEKTAAVAELKRTLVAADTLCEQFASLVRVLGNFNINHLKKLHSGIGKPEGAKAANHKDKDIDMVRSEYGSLMSSINGIHKRISAHEGFDKILHKVRSGYYSRADNSKLQPVATTSSSVNSPSDELHCLKPMTTMHSTSVSPNNVIGPYSAESGAIAQLTAQAGSSTICLTPHEAAAIKESLITKTRPLVTELRPGIIVKAGPRTVMYEARATEFVGRYTSVSVPQVLASFELDGFPVIVMTKIKGTTLKDALESQSPWLNVPLVCKQVRDAVRQLRSVPLDTVLGPGASDRIAPVCDAWDPKTGVVRGGPGMDLPVSDVSAFQRLVTRLDFTPSEERVLARADPQAKTVLCHGDLSAFNIMVGECGLTGIIDWECLGTYPPEWELEATRTYYQGPMHGSTLAFSYIPPHLPCSQTPRAGQACTRRQGCHSAECVKSLL